MLYLIRHAEAVGNAQGRVMGQLDQPLTERGRAQAAALGQWLAAQGVRFRAVYSSDLVRAADTARAVAAACAAGVAVRLEPDLREVGRGAMEGCTFAEAAELRRLPAIAGTFEPEERVFARLARLGATLRLEALDGDVAAVGHGGSLTRLLRLYLGMGAATEPGVRLMLANTGVSILAFEPGGTVALHGHNLRCHLAAEGGG
jgi:probable phosphoglycerate mutase